MMENGIIPMVWFALVVVVWGLTIYQSHRLYRKFVAKYPEIASQEIPYALAPIAHPKKAIFFWKRRAVDLLRSDEILWRERRWFVGLSIASVVVFSFGFLMFFYAVLHH